MLSRDLQIQRMRAIHSVAANVYWRAVEIDGFQKVNAAIDDSEGAYVVKHPLYAQEVEKLIYRPFDVEAFACEVAEHAIGNVRSNSNMDGLIYLEDEARGRSEEAQDIDVSGAVQPVRFLAYQDDPRLMKVGRLCIRHPLPAVVFTAQPIPEDIPIIVDDTKTALGVDYGLMMWVKTCVQATSEKYVCGGIFEIPIADLKHGDRWGKVIQNSNRSINQQLYMD